MSLKLTSRGTLLLSSMLVLATAPGCSIEDFDVDGDGQVTRAEAIYAGFLWLCEEIPSQEEPEEPAPEQPVPEEPVPEEPTPEDPTSEEPVPEEPLPTDPTGGLSPDPTDPLNPF
jgi:clumping factor B